MNSLTKKKQSESDGPTLMRRLRGHFHHQLIETELSHDVAEAVAAPRSARPPISDEQTKSDPEASTGPQPARGTAADGREAKRPSLSGPTAHAGAFKL